MKPWKKRVLIVTTGLVVGGVAVGYAVARHVGLEDVFTDPITWVRNSVDMTRDELNSAYDGHINDLITNYVPHEGDKLVVTIHGACQTNQSSFSGLEHYLNSKKGILCANLDWDYREPVSEQAKILSEKIARIEAKTGIAPENTFYFGHSLGATMALYLLAQNPDIGGVLAVGGAFHGLTQKDVNLISLVNMVPGFGIKKEALEELDQQEFRDIIGSVPKDKVISVYGDNDNSASFETSVLTEGRYVVLPGETHLGEIAHEKHFRLYQTMIEDFANFQARTK